MILKRQQGQLLPRVKEATNVTQEWNSDFGLDKDRKKRLLARILTKARKRLSRQNSTKKCVNLRKKIQVRQKTLV